ncbi:MAG: hypothetical protein KF777_14865 [Planctomycetaceae bacterium]|nr:hypothetical protein [Planctomycetaceae bacterium]
MPEVHDEIPPLEFKSDLALWSLATFVVLVPVLIVVAVCWYRNRPAFPIVVFASLTLLGIPFAPVVSIVSAILLATVILSSQLRSRPSASAVGAEAISGPSTD